MVRFIFLMQFVSVFFLACSDEAVTSNTDSKDTIEVQDTVKDSTKDSIENVVHGKFVTVNGINIVDKDGVPLDLHGVAFGNEVWNNGGIPKYHHQKIDYKRVKDMGMNLIRFYMNTETFEDYSNPYTYKEEGWAWLDTNIAWAKEQGIYLNLNVHVPQGGFQSNGDGVELWTNPENQSRLAAFWKTLAAKYKDEPTIISYDLLNEPGTTESKEQWSNLAQRIVDSIRVVDTNHIIIVERVNSINKSWSEDDDFNFIEVNDPAKKLVYQFHFYGPIEYTHQLTSWTGMGDGGKYPDPTMVTITNEDWVGEKKTVRMASGTTDWTLIEGSKSKITNEKYLVGKPSIEVSLIDSGVVYVDNYYIVEYDENGDSIGVVHENITEDLSGLWLWSETGEGKMSLVSDTINGGKKVVKITGCTSYANAGNNNLRFKVTLNHSYKIVAWMRGENIPTSALAGMKLDFEYSESGVTGRDKAMLRESLTKYIDWIHAKGVPAYLGEFGVYKECFLNDKGGLQWVTDVFDILKENNCAYTYHTYHEDSFGLFYGGNSFPDPEDANTALIELITENLK